MPVATVEVGGPCHIVSSSTTVVTRYTKDLYTFAFYLDATKIYQAPVLVSLMKFFEICMLLTTGNCFSRRPSDNMVGVGLEPLWSQYKDTRSSGTSNFLVRILSIWSQSDVFILRARQPETETPR